MEELVEEDDDESGGDEFDDEHEADACGEVTGLTLVRKSTVACLKEMMRAKTEKRRVNYVFQGVTTSHITPPGTFLVPVAATNTLEKKETHVSECRLTKPYPP